MATNKGCKGFAQDPERASEAGKKGSSVSGGNLKMILRELQKLAGRVVKTATVAGANPSKSIRREQNSASFA